MQAGWVRLSGSRGMMVIRLRESSWRSPMGMLMRIMCPGRMSQVPLSSGTMTQLVPLPPAWVKVCKLACAGHVISAKGMRTLYVCEC